MYIVSTPIGNLGDITFRAVDILKKTSYIAAEKVSHTKKLLTHYQIDATCLSFREENRVRSADEIIRLIQSGHDVALVSDAGTPGVSDPGQYLTERCIASGISVMPIPGASSALCALTKSGFPSDQFVFLGFLPRKGKKRSEILAELAGDKRTTIIFESPQRVKKTLSDMDEHIEERPIALCRELTKVHEECLRGTPRELIEVIEGREPLKGEVVLVVSGIERNEVRGPSLSEDELAVRAEEIFKKYPKEKTGSLAEILSDETGVKKSLAYRMIVDAKVRIDEGEEYTE